MVQVPSNRERGSGVLRQSGKERSGLLDLDQQKEDLRSRAVIADRLIQLTDPIKMTPVVREMAITMLEDLSLRIRQAGILRRGGDDIPLSSIAEVNKEGIGPHVPDAAKFLDAYGVTDPGTNQGLTEEEILARLRNSVEPTRSSRAIKKGELSLGLANRPDIEARVFIMESGFRKPVKTDRVTTQINISFVRRKPPQDTAL
jgi:hypothetical protein